MIQFKNQIIPVEVKSGLSGRLRFLHQYVNESSHPYTVRLYAGNFSIEEAKPPEGKKYKLLDLPYYLAEKIEQYLENYN